MKYITDKHVQQFNMKYITDKHVQQFINKLDTIEVDYEFLDSRTLFYLLLIPELDSLEYFFKKIFKKITKKHKYYNSIKIMDVFIIYDLFKDIVNSSNFLTLFDELDDKIQEITYFYDDEYLILITLFVQALHFITYIKKLKFFNS